MTEELRPRIPRKQMEEVENIHHIATEEAPSSFVEALETTCSLAYAAIDYDLDEEEIEEQIIPPDWQIDRLDDEYLQLIDQYLPETWKQSRLVAERVQTVIYHYLLLTIGDVPINDKSTYEEADTQKIIKESIESARLEEDPQLSTSAVRSTCHNRLYGGRDVSPAREFENACEDIRKQVEKQNLGAPSSGPN